MGKRKNRAMADGGSRCRRSASASADMVEWLNLNDNIEFESGMDRMGLLGVGAKRV